MQTYADRVPDGLSFQPRPPSIKANHIDGPMLVFSDGQCHWLTVWEHVRFRLGLTDADAIQRKRRPNLVRQLGL